MEAFGQTLIDIYMFTMWWLPILAALTGLGLGIRKYVRSIRYMYHYYVEYGELPVWMGDDRGENDKMAEVIVDKGLDEDFKPVGYFTGLVQLVPWTLIGTLLGFAWPAVVVIAIFSVPARIIKHAAKEDRKKAMFIQRLEGDEK